MKPCFASIQFQRARPIEVVFRRTTYALILATLSTGCGSSPSPSVKPKYTVARFAEPDNTVIWRDLGLEIARFEINAPPDTKVTIWLETHRKGKLDDELSFGYYEIPPDGQSIRKNFRWSLYRPPNPTIASPQKVKLEVGFDGSSSAHWIDDPFAGAMVTGGRPSKEEWDLEIGRTITVWSRGACWGNGCRSGSDEFVMENDLAMFLKCRVEPAPPGRGKLAWESGSYRVKQ